MPFTKFCATDFPFEDWATRRGQIEGVAQAELARHCTHIADLQCADPTVRNAADVIVRASP
jgi:hypothetical protein